MDKGSIITPLALDENDQVEKNNYLKNENITPKEDKHDEEITKEDIYSINEYSTPNENKDITKKKRKRLRDLDRHTKIKIRNIIMSILYSLILIIIISRIIITPKLDQYIIYDIILIFIWLFNLALFLSNKKKDYDSHTNGGFYVFGFISNIWLNLIFIFFVLVKTEKKWNKIAFGISAIMIGFLYLLIAVFYNIYSLIYLKK